MAYKWWWIEGRGHWSCNANATSLSHQATESTSLKLGIMLLSVPKRPKTVQDLYLGHKRTTRFYTSVSKLSLHWLYEPLTLSIDLKNKNKPEFRKPKQTVTSLSYFWAPFPFRFSIPILNMGRKEARIVHQNVLMFSALNFETLSQQ